MKSTFHSLRPGTLSLLTLLCALPATAQRRAIEPAEPAAGPQDAPAARPPEEPGRVTIVPIDRRDDAVPLPLRAVLRETPDGPVVESAAGGDPFVLGFAAGEYRPAPGERIGAELAALAPAGIAALADGRPEPVTYGFAMFRRRITAERVAELEALGARVLGFHPHYALRLAMPIDAVERIAALDSVRWVGAPKRWQKLHPELSRRLAALPAGGTLEVWINVYDSDLNAASISTPIGELAELSPEAVAPLPQDDPRQPRVWRSNGWQQRALEATGTTVREWAEGVRAFRARLTAEELGRVLDLDFVQFLDLDLPKVLLHDESTPLINADRTRATYDGGTTQSAVGGMADTGLDWSHQGIGGRWGVGWTFAGGSPFSDGHGHGSHVGGTMFGSGAGQASLKGVAPDLGWGSTGRLFTAKVFDDNGVWGGASIATILDVFDDDFTDSLGNTTPFPHVVNHSYGTLGTGWYGTETDPRAIDIEVYIHQNLHVWASGNQGPGAGTLIEEASSKNAFVVGNVLDWRSGSSYPGTLANNSSRGPAADGRWKPNVVAPGNVIRSVQANTSTGYVNKSGTSMAAPHIAGVAAQLCDKFPFLRYRASTLGAVMMAGSLTKGGQTISTATDGHLDTYGTGRVDAYRAWGGDSEQAFYMWGFDLADTGWGQLDFSIGEGATQLTVVMLYHEISASSGASQALVNDLDMYIDREPFASGGASGDYFAHQSAIDNSEIRILNNPGAGNWRIKVFPEAVSSGWFNSSHVGVCAIVNYGDVTPDQSLTVTRSDAFVKPGEQVDVNARVYVPSHIGSALFLDTQTNASFHAASTTLADGTVTNLMNNPHSGRNVLLGNIRHHTSRSVDWRVSWSQEGNQIFRVNSIQDNGPNGLEDVYVVVDGTAPSGPSNLDSPTHDEGGMSCNTNVTVTWSPATDALSGLDGYVIAWNQNPNHVITSTTPNLGAGATQTSQTLAVSHSPWYFHIRAIDKSGNGGTTRHFGPVRITSGGGVSYCVGAPNSVGLGAYMSFSGSLRIGTNNLTLRASDLPPNRPCLFFYGPNQVQVAFGNGYRCVGGSLYRLPVINTGNGTTTFAVDYTDLPPGGDIFPFTTWNFQNWYRDPAGGGAFFNLTDALQLTFCE